jgi:predicted aminopeptidase
MTALRVRACSLGLLLWSFPLPGCYFTDLASRQLELVNEQRPLPRAWAEQADPERKRMLGMVPDIRAFASGAMQLPVGRSYAGYYETEAKGIAFVLVASERTRLRAYTWWFPVVGEVAYKSFVDEAQAQQAGRALQSAGYDTFVGRVTAYSTLGFFRDPVTSVMMRKGMVAFVDVLLHEMAHAHLYVPGHTDWNEQLASFVGRTGAAQYLRSRFMGVPDVMAELVQREHKRQRVEAAVLSTLREVEAFYASGRPRQQLLRERGRLFAGLEHTLRQLYPEEEDAQQLVVNNAHLLQYRRYLSGAEEFERMWAASGASWPRFWHLCEERARDFQ